MSPFLGYFMEGAALKMGTQNFEEFSIERHLGGLGMSFHPKEKESKGLDKVKTQENNARRQRGATTESRSREDGKSGQMLMLAGRS